MNQIVYITDGGRAVAQKLMKELNDSHLLPIKAFSSENFRRSESVIFVGDMATCIRTIAPVLKYKNSEPSVICVDSQGLYAVSVLGNRIGGADELTRRIARILGGSPIITNQSDKEGAWSLDTLAPHFGWQEEHRGGRMNHIIYHYLNGKPTVLKFDIRGERSLQYLRKSRLPHVAFYDPNVTPEPDSLLIAVSHYQNPTEEPFEKTILYRPAVLHLSVECTPQCEPGEYPRLVRETMHVNNLSEKSLVTIDTTTALAGERFIKAMQMAFPWAKLIIHEEAEANCQSMAESYGPLMMKVQPIEEACRVAVSISRQSQLGGHVEIVGAGPGDVEMISVRGVNFLHLADLILYDEEVSERLTHHAKEGCCVRSKASMTKEEATELMKQYYNQGMLVVNLLAGDACSSESAKMLKEELDAEGIRYHVTPGIA